MTNFGVLRENMVESQVRPNDVTDRRIIRAMSSIERELFVPSSMRPLAYMEGEIEVRPASDSGPARAMLSPMVLAKLTQLAEIEKSDLLLDIGCSNGYSTALFARLSDSVVGLECDERLAKEAGERLGQLNVDNAAIVTGPLQSGYPSEGPYDVIFLNGSVPELPMTLVDQLKEGGRLVTIVGSRVQGRAVRILRTGGEPALFWSFDASAPELPGFVRKPAFAL